MTEQIAAAVIFLVMFIMIVADKTERYKITLICGGITLVAVFGMIMKNPGLIFDALNPAAVADPRFWYLNGQTAAIHARPGINWETVFFITGMMIMVDVMAESGFFKWLCLTAAKAAGYRTRAVFFASMALSAALAMFIDSITVIMFLAAVTIELSSALRFSPEPFILAQIFCANLGGSATMCGDPPNIIIGTSLGYSFGDFLVNTGPIALISAVSVFPFFYLCFRKELNGAGISEQDKKNAPKPGEAIADRKRFLYSSLIFLTVTLLLATHGMTGLTVASVGVIAAALSLAAAGRDRWKSLKKVDYKTVLFFIGLFIVVSGLEYTGVLEMTAEFIGGISGGNQYMLIFIIIWLSGIASAFVDNIPFAAAMIPVINSLALSQGADMGTLSWSLAMGTDTGGSATPIGASANVVGLAAARRHGRPVSWGRYCRYMVPASAIVMLISTIWIFWRYL